MSRSKPYNGHKNWNHWNVSLWIGNDEALYNYARECIRYNRTLDRAARVMARNLEGQKTPDGAPYTYTTVRAAITGMGR